MRDDVFTKQVLQPGSAHAEAAGLRWLRAASNHVVDVVSGLRQRQARRRGR